MGEKKRDDILGRRRSACKFSDVAISKWCVECSKAVYQQEQKGAGLQPMTRTPEEGNDSGEP